MGRLRISPDDRWVAFNDRAAGSMRIYVVPFRPGETVARDKWIAITPEDTVVNAPLWAANGVSLYYLSNLDGNFCVWHQTIDSATGRFNWTSTAR